MCSQTSTPRAELPSEARPVLHPESSQPTLFLIRVERFTYGGYGAEGYIRLTSCASRLERCIHAPTVLSPEEGAASWLRELFGIEVLGIANSGNGRYFVTGRDLPELA